MKGTEKQVKHRKYLQNKSVNDEIVEKQLRFGRVCRMGDDRLIKVCEPQMKKKPEEDHVEDRKTLSKRDQWIKRERIYIYYVRQEEKGERLCRKEKQLNFHKTFI